MRIVKKYLTQRRSARTIGTGVRDDRAQPAIRLLVAGALGPGPTADRDGDPERDAELAVEAAGLSAAFLAAIARRARRVTREEAQREHDRRSVRMWAGRDGF
jgi:hypothetical protein